MIKQNESTEKQENKTNKHHIIPKFYFKMLGLSVDNSAENLVHLLYKDHILVHYYLCLCTKGQFKYKLSVAFFQLVNRKWKYKDFNPEIDLSEYQKIYEEYMVKHSEMAKNLWITTDKLDKYFYIKYLNSLKDKNILFIGEFPCIPIVAYYNNVVVWTNEMESNYGDNIIVQKLYKQEDYIDMSKNIEKDKFDIIIANPPYQIANKVIKNCIDKAKEAIVLMPVKNYKAQELYKHVLELEIVDPKNFKDASISSGLCISKLINKNIEQTYFDVEVTARDPNFKIIYEYNKANSLKRQFKESLITGSTPDNNPFGECDFCCSFLAPNKNNGVMFGGFDYAYNISKDPTILSKWCKSITYITFQTKKQKDNFAYWWFSVKHNKGLCSKLLFGLRKHSAPFIDAIPVIDWGKDALYTDEYVLNQLGLEWKDETHNSVKVKN